MNRRIRTLLVALLPVFVLAIAGSLVTVPFVALGPGPTFNTLGDKDGGPVVDIQGVPIHQTSGNLNMTTVAVQDGLNIFDAFGFWVDGRYGLVPRAEVYPPDVPRDKVDESNKADFKQSEDNAELAALHYLKYPTVVKLGSVAADGPAHDALRAGDQLLSVAGKPIATSQDVVDAVRGAQPGTVVPVRLRRDGAEQTVDVKLGARPDDSAKGYLGVTPDETPDGPVKMTFNLSDVGGPSAGLMFTLAVIDKMSAGDLNGGKFVAGTGTIDPQGKVGPIGGIQYKMVAAREAGAETFLVPADNCTEALQHHPDGLRLVKVDTLNTAVDALRALDAGQPAPACG
ncbi:YlbL family protein [Nocardia stercoris]|uniref:YlbL family protein n=1 Tax=Nocardia stercoris TaxID=2483361 RepID=UPI0018F726CC|nr:PDZ domain-containing protein [Nocardia stercoris]